MRKLYILLIIPLFFGCMEDGDSTSIKLRNISISGCRDCHITYTCQCPGDTITLKNQEHPTAIFVVEPPFHLYIKAETFTTYSGPWGAGFDLYIDSIKINGPHEYGLHEQSVEFDTLLVY